MTKLHITNANDGPELYIKPVPGQIVATVDPGPDQRFYAALFAVAPELLKAAREVCAFMDHGAAPLTEQIERFDRLSKHVYKIPVAWITEAHVMIVARDFEEAIDLAYNIVPDDCEGADYRVGSFEVDEDGAHDLAVAVDVR